MCLQSNRDFAIEIAAAACERGVPAVINSSDATDDPETYLRAGFETIIVGELEMTLMDLCRTPLAGCGPRPGTAKLSSEGHVIFGAPQQPIAHLDQLPPPAWDLLDPGRYRSAWREAHGYFSLNLVSSRGCPYRCNWCAKPLYGSNYRHYSPDRVAGEMQRLKELFSPDQLWFADDIFGLSARWTREFAESVERRGAHIPFRIQSRCDLMTRGTVEALRRAGCVEIWMGAESGSQRILDGMDKGIRVEHIYDACENLRRHDIRACLFLQFGYLGEEWEDIEATLRMVRKTKPDDIGISVSYPIRNTRFHEIVNAQLGPQATWSHSGDLRQMFRSQFPTEFYRALADALHLEVREPNSASEVRLAWDKVEELRCACC
jgi:radical SAM superfamily enzyme YgiQ (UPF0313 family)